MFGWFKSKSIVEFRMRLLRRLMKRCNHKYAHEYMPYATRPNGMLIMWCPKCGASRFHSLNYEGDRPWEIPENLSKLWQSKLKRKVARAGL